MFELSDFEEVKLTQSQFQEWHKLETAQLNALWRIAEILTLLKDRQQEVLEAASADLTKWLAIQNQTFTAGFASVVEAIAKIQAPEPPRPQMEVRFMFVVKDDNAPVNFSLALGDVTDAEGNVVKDANLDVTVESSDTSVVSVDFNAFDRKGVVSFGSPGVASLTAKVTSGDKLLGSGAADFTVTVGDPAAITSVGLNFEGLTEAPPAEG
jgi:hypothetical protein